MKNNVYPIRPARTAPALTRHEEMALRARARVAALLGLDVG